MSTPEIRDAATLLLLRAPEAGASPEVFLVQRTGRAAFMANALVFPGGRVDAADADPAWSALCDGAPQEGGACAAPSLDGHRGLAFRVAALRETFEEAGILLAHGAASLDLPAARAALHAGRTSFLDLVRDAGLRLQTSALTYLARWITPERETRRFDTRFFTALAPPGQAGAHDAQETTASAWMTPAATVAAYERGENQLAPPTLRILMELARFDGAAGGDTASRPPAELGERLRADALRTILGLRGGAEPEIWQPTYDTAASELTLIFPGDEARGGPPGTRNRMVLRGERWRSEGRGF